MKKSRNSRVVVGCLWSVLLVMMIGIRVAVGEWMCVLLLVKGTTIAYTCCGRSGCCRGDEHEPGLITNDGDDDASRSSTNRTSLVTTGNDDVTRTNDAIIDGATSTPLPIRNRTLRRLPFLDNVKTFLTALVVTHHSACAFGGCGGEGAWYLIVDGNDGSPEFQIVLKTFVLWNQSYFMSLFLPIDWITSFLEF